MNYEIESESARLEFIRRIRRISQLLSQLCTEYEEGPDSATVASIKQWIAELVGAAKSLDVSYQEENP